MLDRALTERIAMLVSGGDADAGALPGDLAVVCADAEQRVMAYTGLRPATALPVPEAIGRPAWVSANVASMDTMLDPLAGRLGEGLGLLREPAGAAAGALVSAEVGALTGYLSQRVLGQYELALLDPETVPRLLFVAPNIRAAAGRLAVDPEELLAWIAFHEVTHAVQFAAVPWLRAHLAELLHELLASLDVKLDPAALLRLPRTHDVRALARAVRDGGLTAVLAGVGGDGVHALLDRVQIVMAVIEGHAEHVMDVVGRQALPSLDLLRAALDRRRRERPPMLRLLERLIGLDAKLRQYETGKAFCDGVAARGGTAGLHRVFDGPDRLPTAAELADPAAWLRRTGVRRVTR